MIAISRTALMKQIDHETLRHDVALRGPPGQSESASLNSFFRHLLSTIVPLFSIHNSRVQFIASTKCRSPIVQKFLNEVSMLTCCRAIYSQFVCKKLTK